MSKSTRPNRFEVYLNKRAMGNSKKRIYSLRNAATNLVSFSNNLVLLEDVEMVVQQSGRDDTLKRLNSNAKITRTVHSFIRGKLLYRGARALKKAKELGLIFSNKKVNPIGYDPRKSHEWLLLDNYQMPANATNLKPITHANYALMHSDGILVI
ncbi:MAG: hypothetical protein JKX90_02065 [Colwellia sp.]|nr:hypothetical protein [Colwellia sp.]